MRLSRNMASMRIFNSYTKNLAAQSKSYGNISSGNKIQTYRDDPNAKAKSDKLKLEIRGLQMANRNIQDSVSLIQTMDGGMQSISESLQRARELMVQAGGATTPEDRAVIQKEIDQNLEHITYNTEMNGVKLLADKNNPGDTVDLLIGATSEDVIKMPTYNFTSSGLGLVSADGSNKISVESIDDGLNRLDVAIDKLSSGRGKYGALSNRMESTGDYTSEITGKVEGAEAEITGTDIALEMVEYAKNSILVESGMAMMAQSNEFPQDILQILSNVYPNR